MTLENQVSSLIESTKKFADSYSDRLSSSEKRASDLEIEMKFVHKFSFVVSSIAEYKAAERAIKQQREAGKRPTEAFVSIYIEAIEKDRPLEISESFLEIYLNREIPFIANRDDYRFILVNSGFVVIDGGFFRFAKIAENSAKNIAIEVKNKPGVIVKNALMMNCGGAGKEGVLGAIKTINFILTV